MSLATSKQSLLTSEEFYWRLVFSSFFAKPAVVGSNLAQSKLFYFILIDLLTMNILQAVI